MTVASLKLTSVDKGGCGSLVDGEVKGIADMVFKAADGLSAWGGSGKEWNELAD